MAHYSINLKRLVPFGKLKWFAVEPLKLSNSTIDATIVTRRLYVNLILVVIFAQKTGVEYLECLSEGLACSVVVFCALYCQIVRYLKVCRGVQSQVEDFLRCSLTMPCHLNQEFKLENALILIVLDMKGVLFIDVRVLVITNVRKEGHWLGMAK